MDKKLNSIFGMMQIWRWNISSLTSIRYAHRNFPDLRNLQNPFFIIGVPGCLHVLELCIRFIPQNVDVVLVSNGLSDWELAWARNRLQVRSIVKIPKTILHGSVLDLLFEEFPKPFGILDYDCFVINPIFFQKIQTLDSDSMVNAIFSYDNPLLKIEFPETFFLFFNTPIMNQLIHKYHVSSKLSEFIGLSKKVRKQIAKIGINEDHYPEVHKGFFDTLRLLFSLGKVDGYKFNFIEKFSAIKKPNYEIFHVGGVTSNKPRTAWDTRGMYLWRRSLELNEDEELKKRYLGKYGKLKSGDLWALNPKFSEMIGNEFTSFVDKLITYEVQK